MDSLKITAKGIRCIIGLGNPGPMYANTRHNLGAWLIQAFCEAQQLKLSSNSRLSSAETQWLYQGHTVRLFIPNTFMNHSGRAVKSILHYYHLHPAETLIVHDDLDLPNGSSRLKKGGGHGGHNGLRDIIQQLGNPDFCRLRLGIGRPAHPQQAVATFVLETPSSTEKQQLLQAINTTLPLLPDLVMGQWDRSVQYLHTGDSHGR